jgi:hypothetical protein
VPFVRTTPLLGSLFLGSSLVGTLFRGPLPVGLGPPLPDICDAGGPACGEPPEHDHAPPRRSARGIARPAAAAPLRAPAAGRTERSAIGPQCADDP